MSRPATVGGLPPVERQWAEPTCGGLSTDALLLDSIAVGAEL